MDNRNFDKAYAEVIANHNIRANFVEGCRVDTIKTMTPSVREIAHSLASIKAMRDEYVSLGFTVPKDMGEEINTLIRQAKSRYREDLEANLAAAKKKADELKSKEKQREEAESEIARLTAELEGK